MINRLLVFLFMSFAFILFVSITPAAAAGTIRITTTTSGIGVDGCSLQEAIDYANGGEAQGCSGGLAKVDARSRSRAVNTLSLSTGVYTLERAITVNSSMDIQNDGSGAVILQAVKTPNADERTSLINIEAGQTDVVTLSGLMLQGGQNCVRTSSSIVLTNVMITNCTGVTGGGIEATGGANVTINGGVIENNHASAAGGGIYMNTNTSTLNITDVTFTGNSAVGSGQAQGGAIHFQGSTLSISGGGFTGNYASAQGTIYGALGGAIYTSTGNATIQNTTFSNNYVQGPNATSGAVQLQVSGTGLISNVVFSGNYATSPGITSHGAGFFSADHAASSLTINNSQFLNNYTTNGTYTQAGAAGFISSGVINITGTSFSGNSATGSSGGTTIAGAIYTGTWGGAVINISGSSFIGNSATGSGANSTGGAIQSLQGALNVTETIFQENIADGNGDAIFNDLNYNAGSVTSSVDVTSSCIVSNGDTAVSNIDPPLLTARGNWWGDAWGPQITGAGGGSALSNGDSIDGDGTTPVDVGLTDAGTDSSAPTGDWAVSYPDPDFPNIPSGCATCSPLSSVGHGRDCS